MSVADQIEQHDKRTIEIEGLIARLRAQAQRESDAHKMMAEAKSLRQADNPEGRTDLYSWPTPEQTDSWKAADLLEAGLDAVPAINVKAERGFVQVKESSYPEVLRIEREDDGSFTAVIDGSRFK